MQLHPNITVTELADPLLKKLQLKSHRFKYLANITSISSKGHGDNVLHSTFGASWDPDNDGVLIVKVQIPNSDDWLVVSVAFVTSF